MRILCLLNKHRFTPRTVFYTTYSDTGKSIGHHGLECVGCGKRKLRMEYRASYCSPEEKQQAYDWLNRTGERPKGRVLKLVKR